jgi:hypothetical protein
MKKIIFTFVLSIIVYSTISASIRPVDEMRKYEDVTDPASGSTYSQCITYGLNCRVK